MLEPESLDAREEKLRKEAASLSDRQRAEFYRLAEKRTRDPDTYAALNWLFIAGLHHFYLGRWLRGASNLFVMLIGAWLLFTDGWLAGLSLLLALSIAELIELFRSQQAVRNFNCVVMEDLLKRYSS
ncbi:MAG: TM2 domain-containing protein, partial [Spiribacter sp.]|jgi:TM2 domain-containing membrane protein YozV|nr:TM2 domain-containing protein [Spiribacter sp.]MDR9489898.1 TM2 domain-containing protein [Spiribacter sp.]